MIEINGRYQGIHRVIAYMGLDTGSQLITKSRQRNSVHVRKMVKRSSEKRKQEERNSERTQKRTYK